MFKNWSTKNVRMQFDQSEAPKRWGQGFSRYLLLKEECPASLRDKVHVVSRMKHQKDRDKGSYLFFHVVKHISWQNEEQNNHVGRI